MSSSFPGRNGWIALVALAFAAGLLWLGLGAPRAEVIVVGAYGDWQTLRGWHPPEPLAGGSGRWSGAESSLWLPAGGPGSGVLRLRLHAPGVPAEVRLTGDGAPLAFTVAGQPRQYRLLLPIPPGERIELGVATPLTSPAGDTRALGVAASDTVRLTRLDARPLLPLVAALSGAALLAAAAARLLSPGRPWGAVAAAALLLAGLGAAGLLLPPDQRRHLDTVALALPAAGLAALAVTLLAMQLWGRHVAGAALLAAGALVVGAALRFWRLDWAMGYPFHPDETSFNSVALDLRPPWNPNYFIYGHLPLYLYRASAWLLTLAGDESWLREVGRLVLVSRFYAALASVATLALVGMIGARLARGAGLWAMWLLTGAWLAVQHAHFGTTDALITLQITLLAYLALRYLEGGGRLWLVAMGVTLGAAVATKITAGTFALLPLSALLLRAAREGPNMRARAVEVAREGALLSVVAVVTCLVCAPYYLIDWRGLLFDITEEGDVATSGMASYTYQFIGTWPYLYQIWSGLFTLGPALLGLGLAGIGFVVARAVRERRRDDLLLLAWPAAYMLFMGPFHVKYIRYMLPLLPFLCLYAALLLAALIGRGGLWRHLGRALGVACVALTIGYGLVFAAGVYGRPDPRVVASWWIYQHVPHGSLLLREQYGLRLPLDLREPDNPLAPPLGHYLYRSETLRVYEPSVAESPPYYAATLAAADYLVLTDRSQHVTFRQLPEEFPVRACLYDQLMEGRAGYELAAAFSSGPWLGPWRLVGEHDPGVEETLQVFDHPTVLVLRRVGTPESVRAQIEAACPAPAASAGGQAGP